MLQTPSAKHCVIDGKRMSLKGVNSSGNDPLLQMWAGFKNSLAKTWKVRYKYVVTVFRFTPPSFPETK